jgi:glutathione S-transferase
MAIGGGEIILHHYDTSPFSEKIRLLLGLKGLSWRSVIQPTIMPKPQLTPLTGGYRRAPVMQIGADVFCDSQVILAELDRRGSGPAANRGGAFAVNLWADRLFFGSTVPIIFGEIGDNVPKAFMDDREKLSGRPFDVTAMRSAGQMMKGQWRAQAGWIEQALESGDFLGGDTPSLADIAAYMNVWFLLGAVPATGAELLKGLDRVQAWRTRIAAIGHGQRTEATGAEALEAARANEPSITVDHDDDDPLNLSPGAAVMVMADDYGRDPITGTLVAANRDRVILARHDDDLGHTRVHFPRAGYVVVSGKAG